MKIYDISQEVFGCSIYPGDPAPQKTVLSSIKSGDVYNLSEFSMCAHNGTHIDAPYHFIESGKTVDKIPLEKVVGECVVVEYDRVLTAEDAKDILLKGIKRILIKGKAEVSAEAAKEFAKGGAYLIGNESQTVGPETAPMEVHKILLSKEIVLLEGIRLSHVPEGKYILNAAPLNLSGAEGSPCRAVLMDLEM